MHAWGPAGLHLVGWAKGTFCCVSPDSLPGSDWLANERFLQTNDFANLQTFDFTNERPVRRIQ
jgi:hypothetical protein